MNYRPDNWERVRDCGNPWGCEYPSRKKEWEKTFDAGADAMLEALRGEGEVLKGRKRIGFIWDAPMYGTLVLIPDEEGK